MSQNQETLGQYLKRERESHRVPVQEIALFMKVNRSFIDALEADDFDIFARRFECERLVKQYISYLKLNQTAVLRLFGAQWKLTGGVKRYPKLTQFADGDSSPAKSFIFKGKRLFVGQSPARWAWLSVIVGVLVAISVIFIELPNTKQEITHPDPLPLQSSGPEVEVLPAKDRVPPPAAETERRTVSPKQISTPDAPQPRKVVAERKIPSQSKGVIVIGNRDSKRYHLQGMKYYDSVKAYHRVVFQSEKEAIRAGYRRAQE